MMSDYAIMVRLAGRRCLVVGGGAVAARKARGLARARARVVVVAPEISGQLPEGVEVCRRAFCAADLDGAFLAVAATDSPQVNAQVAEAAERAGILVNVADDPEAGSFHVPACVRRGEFTLAVSTGGAGPALARRVRERLEGEYGPAYGQLCQVLAAFRRRVRQRIADPDERRRILEAAGDPALAARVAAEGLEAVRLHIEGLLPNKEVLSPES